MGVFFGSSDSFWSMWFILVSHLSSRTTRAFFSYCCQYSRFSSLGFPTCPQGKHGPPTTLFVHFGSGFPVIRKNHKGVFLIAANIVVPIYPKGLEGQIPKPKACPAKTQLPSCKQKGASLLVSFFKVLDQMAPQILAAVDPSAKSLTFCGFNGTPLDSRKVKV